MKNFIALVPMGGEYEGVMGQHFTKQVSAEAAKKWASDRFTRIAVIVEVGDRTNSLDAETAQDKYNKGISKKEDKIANIGAKEINRLSKLASNMYTNGYALYEREFQALTPTKVLWLIRKLQTLDKSESVVEKLILNVA